MDFLFEGPWPILTIGLALEAVLGFLLLQSRRGNFLMAMIAVAGLTGVGLVVERWVVTDREVIADTLDQAAEAVATNNLDRLLACVSPQAAKTQRDSRWVLAQCEFKSGWIRALDVKINRLTSPPTAKAKFTANGEARDRATGNFSGPFSKNVTVTMRKEGDRWLIGDYSVEDFEMPH